jgi:hypothetical protein
MRVARAGEQPARALRWYLPAPAPVIGWQFTPHPPHHVGADAEANSQGGAAEEWLDQSLVPASLHGLMMAW